MKITFKKVFFLDANALVRLYYKDLGYNNLNYICNYGNHLLVTIDYAFLEIFSALAKAVNIGIISRIEAERIQSYIHVDMSRNVFRVLDSNPFVKSYDTKKTLFKYALNSGMSFGTADSLYLAACKYFATSIVKDKNKVIFVTSDKRLYNAANSFSEFSSFHFWTCNLGNDLIDKFIPTKNFVEKPAIYGECANCGTRYLKKAAAKTPNKNVDGTIFCSTCKISVCPSTYVPDF
jgi:predicted nucleic acid-binding protein